MSSLADKIELHLQLGEADPGFDLGEDDLREIVRALRAQAATPERSFPNIAWLLEQIADCDNPEMMRGKARQALSALRAAATSRDLAEENQRLRDRLGPRGLEVVEIDGAGHYVNEKVKAEIEKLRRENGYAHGYAAKPHAFRKNPHSKVDECALCGEPDSLHGAAAAITSKPVGWRWKWGEADFWKMTNIPDLVPKSAPTVEPLYVDVAQPSTDRCVKCGCETKGEMAWVDGDIWCHPCADAPRTPEQWLQWHLNALEAEFGPGSYVLVRPTTEPK